MKPTVDEALTEIRREMERARANYNPEVWNVVHDELKRLNARCDSAVLNETAAISERDKLRGELELRIQRLQAQAKIDNEGNQDWINSLCEQLCKMEDALGFKNDCYDKQGKWIPTIGPWMERLRDLLATEGEVGDLKSELSALRNALAQIAGFNSNTPKIDGARKTSAAEGWYQAYMTLKSIARQAIDAARADGLKPGDILTGSLKQ